jgi:hypothetical protein
VEQEWLVSPDLRQDSSRCLTKTMDYAEAKERRSMTEGACRFHRSVYCCIPPRPLPQHHRTESACPHVVININIRVNRLPGGECREAGWWVDCNSSMKGGQTRYTSFLGYSTITTRHNAPPKQRYLREIDESSTAE